MQSLIRLDVPLLLDLPSMTRKRLFTSLIPGLSLALTATTPSISLYSTALSAPQSSPAQERTPASKQTSKTATPIKHLIVIFNENVSFDHYFATYPHAANPPGEPRFIPAPGTPQADTLEASGLLEHNPNQSPLNGADASSPFRLDRTQASTADQNHAYTAEQRAYHSGKADLFPLYTGRGSPGGMGAFGTRGQVMGYYDGNTVTALWRYAQRFLLNDHTYTDVYGPSTPGALSVVSGQTNGMVIKTTTQPPATATMATPYAADGQGSWTMINDIDPANDPCSTPKDQVWMSGPNIGDALTHKGIHWGGFMAGFDLTLKDERGNRGCKRGHFSPITAQWVLDYIPHHNWFQYYRSTANPAHIRPSSVALIGSNYDGANHEYDLEDFYRATKAGHMPEVAFLKLPAFADAHAGYSDPLDEQAQLVPIINFIQSQPEWHDTAIIITYDDSDGWYDHAFTPVQHASYDSEIDQLDGPGQCGNTQRPLGVKGLPVNGRCGPGTRIPFLLLSPWVKQNQIDHRLLIQSSVIRFIEDNWLGKTRLGKGSFDAKAPDLMPLFNFHQKPQLHPLFLDPHTGAILPKAPVTTP